MIWPKNSGLWLFCEGTALEVINNLINCLGQAHHLRHSVKKGGQEQGETPVELLCDFAVFGRAFYCFCYLKYLKSVDYTDICCFEAQKGIFGGFSTQNTSFFRILRWFWTTYLFSKSCCILNRSRLATRHFLRLLHRKTRLGLLHLGPPPSSLDRSEHQIHWRLWHCWGTGRS